MDDRGWLAGLTPDERRVFLKEVWNQTFGTRDAAHPPDIETGLLSFSNNLELRSIGEEENSQIYNARSRELEAHRERAERILDWSERMELKADIDDDAALLVFFFNMEFARRNPNEKLSEEQVDCFVNILLWFAKNFQHKKSVETLEKLAGDYDKNGIPRPLALRTLDPTQYKAKWGRPKGIDKHEQYLDFARRIYAQRRQEGCFPARQWNVEELPFRLSDEIERQIASDAGITHHFERLAEALKIPLSARAISQFYLGDNARNISSLRRIIIIEEMAAYCFEYWFGPNRLI